jgi:cytosine/uracil/thiamine/allantoin permease
MALNKILKRNQKLCFEEQDFSLEGWTLLELRHFSVFWLSGTWVCTKGADPPPPPLPVSAAKAGRNHLNE